METAQIGHVAADVMECLGERTEGKIIAVGLVVVVDIDGDTLTHVETSVTRYWEKIGLFNDAIDTIREDRGE